MSTNQSLPQWFQSRVSAVYDAPDESSRSAALDALLAPQVNVLHNGETKDVEDKRHRVMSQTAASSKIDLKWEKVEESAPDEVKGSYVLTISSMFRVRAAPMQRHVTVNFTAKIADVNDTPSEDSKRVVHLQEQEEIEQAPIHLQSIPKKEE
ncbi:hypothetical protein PENSPDRAFT_679860 [Peniophora sp. CONT]|nr:hypothetical protein PENSPDRAFT_679860 [Peniophora sp. CONT]